MEDREIVSLYLERDENAIKETDKKYGRYCGTIAFNILRSHEDAEECVNDTYAKTWDSIPPAKPNKLGAFVSKITRNLAINRYFQSRAEKRSGEMELILDELEEIIPSGEGDVSDEIALRDAINGFLKTLAPANRIIFVRRYWYGCSVKEIAKGMSFTESNVKVILLRVREKFREYLEGEGITL